MTQLLKYRGLWKLVSGIEAAPPAPANADDNKEQISWEEKNDEAMALITLSLATSELATVRDTANARDAWLAILGVYEAKDLPNKLFLRRQFSNMRLEDGMSMQQHINNIKNVVDQLKSIGSPVTDDDIAVVLLNSLNGKYDSLVVALESRPPEELTSSLIAARKRRDAEAINIMIETMMVVNQHSLLGHHGTVEILMSTKLPQYNRRRRRTTNININIHHLSLNLAMRIRLQPSMLSRPQLI
jgi:gag-polypeptide of LTR copia-type